MGLFGSKKPQETAKPSKTTKSSKTVKPSKSTTAKTSRSKPQQPVYTPVCLHMKIRIADVDGRTRVLCRDCGAPQA